MVHVSVSSPEVTREYSEDGYAVVLTYNGMTRECTLVELQYCLACYQEEVAQDPELNPYEPLFEVYPIELTEEDPPYAITFNLEELNGLITGFQ